jgi:hypothetical protein
MNFYPKCPTEAKETFGTIYLHIMEFSVWDYRENRRRGMHKRKPKACTFKPYSNYKVKNALLKYGCYTTEYEREDPKIAGIV